MRKKIRNRILYRWCRFCCLDLWGGAECFESENEKSKYYGRGSSGRAACSDGDFSSAVADIFLCTHGAGIHLRHMKAQCLPPVKAACLWKKERQPPKAGWNGGFPRYRFRLNR